MVKVNPASVNISQQNKIPDTPIKIKKTEKEFEEYFTESLKKMRNSIITVVKPDCKYLLKCGRCELTNDWCNCK